mmetsp:Transcript_12594/g.36187  ORF Transcript_12594/g.36187 Transcript_12594/m.36187 type:complete len:82 (-) Transcript_12594:52-297(-)
MPRRFILRQVSMTSCRSSAWDMGGGGGGGAGSCVSDPDSSDSSSRATCLANGVPAVGDSAPERERREHLDNLKQLIGPTAA